MNRNIIFKFINKKKKKEKGKKETTKKMEEEKFFFYSVFATGIEYTVVVGCC